MTPARHRLSDEERAEMRREIMGEIQSIFDTSDSFEEVRDKFDERDPAPLDYADVRDMTEEQINNDWSRVSEVMERGPDAAPPAPDDSRDARRLATGQQLRSEHAGHESAISKASLAAMSHEEIVARKAEIDAWLAAGGANR